jgi:hypothetical protein
VRLVEIWRYPVKSMAGERLAEAALGRDGVPGDRVLQVPRAWPSDPGRAADCGSAKRSSRSPSCAAAAW